MNTRSRHALLPLISVHLRPWVMGLAMLLQAPLMLAAGLAITHGQAGPAIIGIATLLGLALWAAPLGSLLVVLRGYRELRLPAAPAALRRRLWALMLGLNFLVPAVGVALTSPDAASATGLIAALVCMQMAVPAYFLLPLWCLLLLFPASLGYSQWQPLLSALQAAAGAPLMDLLPALALTALVAWRARCFVHSRHHQGPRSCLLDMQWQRGRTSAGPEGLVAIEAARGASWPVWLVQRTRSHASDMPARRVAQLLGPPFAPGSNRRQLLFLAVVCAGALGLFFISVGNVSVAALAAPGMLGGLLPVLSAGAIFGVNITYAQRLALLYRRDQPELAELALLPGMGDAAQRRRVLVHVLAWRPLQTYAFLSAVAVLMLAWILPAYWPLPLGGLAGLALVWLDAAQYLRRGRGLLPSPGVAIAVHSVVAALCIGLLAAVHDSPARLAVLLGLAAALLLAAWRLARSRTVKAQIVLRRAGA